MTLTKGFFTIATGDEHYYRIAANLVRSYKRCSQTPLPFAILADRENEYTQAFDQVIRLPAPQNNYLDKLTVFPYLPYDINTEISIVCFPSLKMRMISAALAEYWLLMIQRAGLNTKI